MQEQKGETDEEIISIIHKLEKKLEKKQMDVEELNETINNETINNKTNNNELNQTIQSFNDDIQKIKNNIQHHNIMLSNITHAKYEKMTELQKNELIKNEIDKLENKKRQTITNLTGQYDETINKFKNLFKSDMKIENIEELKKSISDLCYAESWIYYEISDFYNIMETSIIKIKNMIKQTTNYDCK